MISRGKGWSSFLGTRTEGNPLERVHERKPEKETKNITLD